GQAEGRRGQLAAHLTHGSAFRAGVRIRVRELLQAIEFMSACGAAESVDGHMGTRGRREPWAFWGFGRLNQAFPARWAWLERGASCRILWRGRRSGYRGTRRVVALVAAIAAPTWLLGRLCGGGGRGQSVLPQGAGGRSTGVVRSNSTWNRRPPGRASS